MEYEIIRDCNSCRSGAEFVCRFDSLAHAKHYVQSAAALGENLDYTYYIYCYQKKIYMHMYKYLFGCGFESL